MSTAPINPDAIRQLVAEVLQRIRTEAAAPASSPAPGSSAYGQPHSAAGIVIPDKVLTLASLQKLPAGTRQLTVQATAVVTPSAREFAHDNGIAIVRVAASTERQPASRRPFVVGRADCPADVAGRCAAIVRAVPGAQQLPATGLADLVASFATHASRDGARAVLLTGRPATAVVLASRSPALRAVTGKDAAALLAAAAECSANLLAINPKDFSAVSLERICVDFASRDLAAPPAELNDTPKPCACKGHAH